MRVHSFESLAAVDGEGLRYAVFLSGCPLRCAYCHNPDSWTGENGVFYTPEQLVQKLSRYAPYFAAGKGGVTFSGGEPLLQADEIVKAGALLAEKGINYALDTSGQVELTESVAAAVEGAELIICDLKFFEEKTFEEYCRGDLKKVFAFLDMVKEKGKRLWLRTVIVPGINDSEKMVEQYAKAAKPYCSILERYELLPFHTMAFFKYEELGIENRLKDLAPMDKERVKTLQQHLNACLQQK